MPVIPPQVSPSALTGASFASQGFTGFIQFPVYLLFIGVCVSCKLSCSIFVPCPYGFINLMLGTLWLIFKKAYNPLVAKGSICWRSVIGLAVTIMEENKEKDERNKEQEAEGKKQALSS
jgi:hypothetical protein